ncbi:putative E3 ubiquitin-protein ligase MARCH [Helianthus annuus]|uniref:E3 ubiquitin-protein ligase MARCH n=1 Tax=Helianthus annuus TaxID=4232 RepID=A0A9K3EBP8_HELAN|nr:putative E3 ubiquitin-protein ligase MARCH [Helianthus annuus]KAJ0469877.1 hypothetical protein HanIR_Chr14g0712711 [Helianthus annuus]
MRNVFVSHLSAKIDPTPLRFFELQIFYIYFIHFTRLVGDMGTSAIALSLLFSCVLGLLSSMTSSTMVKRQFVWLYAAIQFSFVVIFAHVFYDLIHINPVLSILLATFAGCGVVMCASSVLVEVLRLRRRWLARSNNQTDSEPILH